jgi:hypothetical protein
MSSLKKYRMVETGVLHLRDAADAPMFAEGADGKPDKSKPCRIRVYGPGSQQYAAALNEKQNRGVDLLKQKGKTRETAEEAIQSSVAFLCDVTHSFENIESDPPGKKGRDLFMEVYTDQGLSFIRDQVMAFVNETANFSPPSSTPSASTSDTTHG